MAQNIPFVDLKRQYASIKTEINEALQKIMDNTAFILGDAVSNFEKDFAAMHGCKYGVAVNSGTAALHLALLSIGIKQGDEVITVPNTFIATAEAISYCGAIPVFVDVNKDTYNMDPALIEKAITKKTKAILPVHLYGQMADMESIIKIAEKHNLKVVEDCCQSHLAEFNGKRAGSFGVAGCFSFYPGKNLGAYGEGGMIITNDEAIAQHSKMLRSHGESQKYVHKYIGYNYRMEGFQGAVLGVKIKHIEKWTEQRRKNASVYNQLLKEVVKTPIEANGNKHVYHLYIIESPKRDELMKHLSALGISSGLHYPMPIHLQEAYNFLGYKAGDFPVAEASARNILSLPMFPELTDEELRKVCDAIKGFKQ